MKRVLLFYTALAAILTCLATILGYLAEYHWIFDLFSHFRLQYAFILLIASFIFLFFRKSSLIALSIVFLLPNALEVAPVFFGGNKNEDLQQYLKVCSINLSSSSDSYGEVSAFIRSRNPDVVALLEFDRQWKDGLSAVIEEYKYKRMIAREDVGIAILSKVKIFGTETLYLDTAGVPSVLAEVALEDQRIQVLAIHPEPPLGKQAFETRNELFSSIIARKQSLSGNLMIIGDFNTTSYSIYFKKLLEGLDLLDSRKGFGILATWPAYLPPVQIAIDHCLISKSLFVRRREVGPPVGSDHLPVYVEVGFASAGKQ